MKTAGRARHILAGMCDVQYVDDFTGSPRLLVRRHIAAAAAPSGRAPVLYIHGATFPSGLSVAYRFDGRSWFDQLAEAGFDPWAFDFAGFGGSDRYPVQGDGEPRGRADEAAAQIARVAALIRSRSGNARLSIIAHSWGSIAAGRFAGACPEQVDRMVLFGPIAQRDGAASPRQMRPWRDITVDEQWQRFVADVPDGHPAGLARRQFDDWARHYLASDPDSAGRTPASVRVPGGPAADIASAWSGALPYDPAAIRAPVLIIRGEWDSLANDRDAARLMAALHNAPSRRDLKLPAGTHLMHLETGRHLLHREVAAFLGAGQPGLY